MKRIISLALAAALCSLPLPGNAWLAQKKPAGATTSRILHTHTSISAGDAVNTYYMPLGYSASPTLTAHTYSVFSVPGNLTEMRVRATTAPTATRSVTLTVMKNGLDTAQACTIAPSTQTCNITTSVAFAMGDYAAIKITQNNSPGWGKLAISNVFAPSVADNDMIFAHAIGLSTSATQGVAPNSSAASASPAVRRYSVMPDGGTIDRLCVQSTAPGTPASGKKYDYTVVKNGSTITALTIPIQDDAPLNACDTTHSFTVVGSTGGTPSTTIGDDLEFQGAPSSTPTSATVGFGVRAVWSTANRYAHIMAAAISDNATSTTFYPMTGGSVSGTLTESGSQSLSGTQTIKKIAVKLLTAPGAGKSRAFTLRKNGADTALTCTIANTDLGCDFAADVTIADDDLLATADVPTGTPATSTLGISYLATR